MNSQYNRDILYSQRTWIPSTNVYSEFLPYSMESIRKQSQESSVVLRIFCSPTDGWLPIYIIAGKPPLYHPVKEEVIKDIEYSNDNNINGNYSFSKEGILIGCTDGREYLLVESSLDEGIWVLKYITHPIDKFFWIRPRRYHGKRF